LGYDNQILTLSDGTTIVVHWGREAEPINEKDKICGSVKLKQKCGKRKRNKLTDAGRGRRA